MMVSGLAAGETEVWRLDLAAEDREVSPEAFSAWMETKGFGIVGLIWALMNMDPLLFRLS